ncbi:XRE family transcriptional regulator [Faecalicatena contorta]|uniref:helix-turn-helix domain-containing protein n=1 Tax=Faecalicatena contorta TaxID=39482 RepID=UPI002FE6C633
MCRLDIGKKLKELRLQNDLTLGDLASRSELTKGFLSQVERNLTTPSIATLEDILEALGTNLSEFFREEEEPQIVFSDQDFFVDEQEEYQIEWVIPNAQKNSMEPILLTLKPHGKSHILSAHQGEEFGYVLKGSVTLIQENKKYRLKSKETFYLNGAKSHYIYNHTNSEAKILWITTPPLF